MYPGSEPAQVQLRRKFNRVFSAMDYLIHAVHEDTGSLYSLTPAQYRVCFFHFLCCLLQEQARAAEILFRDLYGAAAITSYVHLLFHHVAE